MYDNAKHRVLFNMFHSLHQFHSFVSRALFVRVYFRHTQFPYFSTIAASTAIIRVPESTHFRQPKNLKNQPPKSRRQHRRQPSAPTRATRSSFARSSKVTEKRLFRYEFILDVTYISVQVCVCIIDLHARVVCLCVYVFVATHTFQCECVWSFYIPTCIFFGGFHDVHSSNLSVFLK